jgi:hypothetical protein
MTLVFEFVLHFRLLTLDKKYISPDGEQNLPRN